MFQLHFFVMKSLLIFFTLGLWVSQIAAQGQPFPANPEKQCTLLSGENGIVSSPGYPNPYPENVQQCWLITTPVNTRVQLNIPIFSSQDLKDVLSIYDGADTNAFILRTISGEQWPGSIFTSLGVNSMLLVFTTDDVPSGHTGFQGDFLAYYPA